MRRALRRASNPARRRKGGEICSDLNVGKGELGKMDIVVMTI
jgi:hypothetical protein